MITIFAFKLRTYGKLNCLKYNCYDIWLRKQNLYLYETELVELELFDSTE